jgi:hypothetical protein
MGKMNDTQWINVTERKPEPRTEVLGYDEFYGRVGVAIIADWEPHHLVFTDSDDCSITHWMPLPDDPDLRIPLPGEEVLPPLPAEADLRSTLSLILDICKSYEPIAAIASIRAITEAALENVRPG